MLVINSTRLGEHTPPPGHPERPERQDVMAAVAAQWRQRGGLFADPEPASLDAILRAHSGRFGPRGPVGLLAWTIINTI